MTQANDWIGTVGDAWAAEWRRTDRSFIHLAPRLDAAILAAAPAGGFRALDIGCGAGGTSLALAAERSDAEIVGIDLSDGLIAVARERSAEIAASRSAGLTFLTGDVAAHAATHGPFDLLYSRHGVMFFPDPVAAFAALHAAAAPDAALVFSCFADWSANAFAAALAEVTGAGPPPPGPGPFAFADPARVAVILAEAGWRDATPVRVDFAYRAGAGDDPVGDALSFFQRIGPVAAALRAMPADAHPAAVARLREVIEHHHGGGAVDFAASAWIWSARA
ncbi:class I SAM-dependent methyltransferase [Sphingomonas sp.]|uniref:class I SAM-dependent methyltransferase n=1 Tax=Sphingomonas sp. TaxID=28214 RepID=UPI002DD61A69|nr:class I SAM-dependent methyltransferase [Sphingomonas sp.]